MRRLYPDGLAGRFALLLVAALLAANLVAVVLLSFERDRIGREAGALREIERLVALVPAMEALDPERRPQLARRASTRLARIAAGPAPLVARDQSGPRAAALGRRLSEALGGREVRVALLAPRPDGPRHRRAEGVALSIALEAGGWVNVTAAGLRPPEAAAEGGRAFLTVLGLSLLTVLAVGLLWLRHLTRPLGQLAAAARAAGRGDRSARVPEEGAREMREAAAAFNEMQARIEGFDAERMRVLAAVGHDLRTPITSLRIRAEMLDEAEAEPMVRTLDEMAVMADGLVSYARSGREAEAAEEVELAALLDRLCAERGAVFEGGAAGPVRGRPVALTRAIGNLVDNAIRYGGAARVRLREAGGMAVVEIDDDGPGIPDERREALFEPFARGEASRSAETGGAGLGLSIARSILRAHGGGVELSNRAGGGLRAVVRLPHAT
ncbi:ATP-binding protein [Limimaricola pyoseonensis]|uniref:histidine kinase n=1 Tax=Limimaricola pyoseonensis TaxID=521013 RepID=A0A1G7G057_9RHOB|nr:ATP-binding protein [Limimaricola pyoseonensis]SDE81526.1 Signal transduction histidine kinase [Limimaricola pyoseonensis]